jgi:hypothetical protein
MTVNIVVPTPGNLEWIEPLKFMKADGSFENSYNICAVISIAPDFLSSGL